MANMAKFYKLRVADVRKETADCVSIAFEIPNDIKHDYHYIQGQYLTLKLNVNGEDVRRSYSICSSPAEDEPLRIAVKKVFKGKGSSFINDNLKAGDFLEVMTPMGNFHSPMQASHKKNYVLLAGGSGITPMLSIIKTVLKQEPQSKLVLLYGNLDEEATIFKSEIDRLARENQERFTVSYVFQTPREACDELNKGLMTVDKIQALLKKDLPAGDNEFFICGPTVMMDNAMNALINAGIEKSRIHIEYFSTPVEEKDIDALNSADKLSYVRSQVKVICDGDETTFTLEPNHNVLEAALAANIDAPYACRGGSCCTCRALLVEGKVEMAVNFALLESEVEEGYILTCQSHALTPTLVVDYDKGR